MNELLKRLKEHRQALRDAGGWLEARNKLAGDYIPNNASVVESSVSIAAR